MKNIGPALTWDQLAAEFDKISNGRKARTLEMQIVFEFCANLKDKFVVDKEKGTIHKIIKNEK